MTKFNFILLTFLVIPGWAQIGGKHSFEFLNVPGHAKLAGLGGVNASLTDDNINFLFSNPALVSDSLNGFGSANYQFYLADVGHSTFSYGQRVKNIGFLAIGIQHIGYGVIEGYDASGQATQEFTSGETALVISKSHQQGSYRVGVNMKGVFSNIAGYRSTALLFDIGGVFIHPDKPFTVGLVIKNLGFTFSSYTIEKTSLPFDIQVGTTFKPEYMPLRFSITAYNLSQDDISYFNPQDGNDEPGLLDKVLRHINFSTEILLHKNFTILVGYNYLIHKELKLDGLGGSAGVSFGFNAHIKSLDFAFSRNAYVIGTAGYSFSIAANIKSMLKRKQL